jgi:hypothetical protein
VLTDYGLTWGKVILITLKLGGESVKSAGNEWTRCQTPGSSQDIAAASIIVDCVLRKRDRINYSGALSDPRFDRLFHTSGCTLYQTSPESRVKGNDVIQLCIYGYRMSCRLCHHHRDWPIQESIPTPFKSPLIPTIVALPAFVP